MGGQGKKEGVGGGEREGEEEKRVGGESGGKKEGVGEEREKYTVKRACVTPLSPPMGLTLSVHNTNTNAHTANKPESCMFRHLTPALINHILFQSHLSHSQTLFHSMISKYCSAGSLHWVQLELAML